MGKIPNGISLFELVALLCFQIPVGLFRLLGHRGARSRVMAVLEKQEGEDYGKFTDSSRQSLVADVNENKEQEQVKWTGDDDDGDDSSTKAVSIERRFTIGGGSRNPVVLARRKSVVEESRSS